MNYFLKFKSKIISVFDDKKISEPTIIHSWINITINDYPFPFIFFKLSQIIRFKNIAYKSLFQEDMVCTFRILFFRYFFCEEVNRTVLVFIVFCINACWKRWVFQQSSHMYNTVHETWNCVVKTLHRGFLIVFHSAKGPSANHLAFYKMKRFALMPFWVKFALI